MKCRREKKHQSVRITMSHSGIRRGSCCLARPMSTSWTSILGRTYWPGGSHQRQAVRRRGPGVCFYEKDLYTVKLGSWTTDQIERSFFGAVDSRRHEAVGTSRSSMKLSSLRGARDATLHHNMDAQKFKTREAWI